MTRTSDSSRTALGIFFGYASRCGNLDLTDLEWDFFGTILLGSMATGKAEDGFGPFVVWWSGFYNLYYFLSGRPFFWGDLALVVHFVSLFLFCLYLIGLFPLSFSGRCSLEVWSFFYLFMFL